MKRSIAIAVCLWVGCTVVNAQSRILPTNAISYTGYVGKQEFDTLFPGERIKANETPSDPGYYVVYQHENLVYFFGPEPTFFAAELYKDDLDLIVEEVQVKRAHLKSAKTSVQKFPQDSNAKTAEQNESEGPNEHGTQKPESPEKNKGTSSTPPQPKSWWQRLFDIFKF